MKSRIEKFSIFSILLITMLFLTQNFLATAAPNEVIPPPIPVGKFPHGVVVNENTNTIFVSNFMNIPGTVSVIDGTNPASPETIILSNITPVGIDVNEITGRLYVTIATTSSVPVYDSGGAVSDPPIGFLPVPQASAPVDVAIHESAGKAYVIGQGRNGWFYAFDISNDNNQPLGDDDSRGTLPQSVAVNEVTNKLYIVNAKLLLAAVEPPIVGVFSTIDESFITSITIYDQECGIPIPGSPVIPYNTWCGIAINEKTNEIFVVNSKSGTLTVINGSNDLIVDTIIVGLESYPIDVAVNEDTNKVYITLFNDHEVLVYNRNTDTVEAKIDLTTQAGQTTPHRNPWGLDLNTQTGYGYVAARGLNAAVDGTVAIIEIESFISGKPTIQFDAQCYTEGDTAYVTVTHAGANGDPNGLDTIMVNIFPDILNMPTKDVVLTETSKDSGIFSGKFTVDPNFTMAPNNGFIARYSYFTSGISPIGFVQEGACVKVIPSTASTTLMKFANVTNIQLNNTVLFTYTETNDGNLPIRNTLVIDDDCSPVTHVSGDLNSNSVLDPRESWIFECTKKFPTKGNFTNNAYARGIDPSGHLVAYPSDPDEISSVTITVIPEFETIGIMVLGSALAIVFFISRIEKNKMLNQSYESI